MPHEATSVEKYVHAWPRGTTAKPNGLLCCYPVPLATTRHRLSLYLSV